MSYLSLYRKYRPQSFDSVVGQNHVVATLKNAIANNHLAHAYIFSGSRGTGKTSLARILAKTLNCKASKDFTPCNQCNICLGVNESNSLDVLEIDAASNRGIDEIRQLRERVNFAPVEGQYKIYIIDEVHMLTVDAFNALLKTLEEPPKHVIFILATTEPQKIPETIISRCQRLDFKRINLSDIVSRLSFIAEQEGIEVEEKVLNIVARNAEGGLRDAISLFDQVYSFAGKKITFKDLLEVLGTTDNTIIFQLADAISNNQVDKCLDFVANCFNEGKNMNQLLKDILSHFRYLIFAKLNSLKVIDLPEEQVLDLKKQAEKFDLESLKEIVNIIAKKEQQMRWYGDTRLLLEIALIEITSDKGTENIVSTKKIIKKEDFENKTVKDNQTKNTDKKVINKESSKPMPDLKIDSNYEGKEISLVDIKHNWMQILNSVKNIKLKVYALICDGEPIELENNILTIAFKFIFHKEKMQEAENQKVLISVLEKYFQRKFKINTVLHDIPKKNIKNTTKKEDDFSNQVVDIFGGSFIQDS